MKFQNVLLAAALFLTAGTVFGKKNTETTPADVIVYQDFSSMTTDANSKTLNIMIFEFNGSNKWQYYLYGNPNTDGAQLYQLELSPGTAANSDFGTVIADKVQAAKAAIKNMDIPDGVDVSKSHAIYSFTIPFDDSEIEAFGLSGANSLNNTAFATVSDDFKVIYNSIAANNGMEIAQVDNNDANVLVHAKSQWNFNNGSLFLVSVGSPSIISDNQTNNTPSGQPLPAPVVTLLIALGFGALLVYRRRQVKA